MGEDVWEEMARARDREIAEKAEKARATRRERREVNEEGCLGVVRGIVELALCAVACWLLALVGWRENPGDVWAVIGLVTVPACLLGLLAVVVYEWREERRPAGPSVQRRR